MNSTQVKDYLGMGADGLRKEQNTLIKSIMDKSSALRKRVIEQNGELLEMDIAEDKEIKELFEQLETVNYVLEFINTQGAKNEIQ